MKAWAPTQVVMAIAGMLCAMLLSGVAAAQSGGAKVETNPAAEAATAVTSVDTVPVAKPADDTAPTAKAADAAPASEIAPAAKAPGQEEAGTRGQDARATGTAPVTEKPKLVNPEEDREIGSGPVPASDGTADRAKPWNPGWFGLLWPLVVVLAGIILLFWAARRFLPGMRRMAGNRAVEVLGRTYLSPRQSVTVVKLGRRILVIGQTADQLSPLASISDPEEVSELAGLCESSGRHSATTTFRKIFQRMDREYEEPAGGAAAADASGASEVSAEDIDRVRDELRSLTDKVRQVSTGRKKES